MFESLLNITIQHNIKSKLMWRYKLSIENLNLIRKRVLMRVDFNVPIYDQKITDNKKIIAGLDSIVYAIVKEARSVVIMSHLGKPRGTKNMRYSLEPIAEELNSLLQQAHKDPKSLGKYSQIFQLFAGSSNIPNVRFLSDCIGSQIIDVCQNPPQGSIILLENLKFHSEEEGYGLDTSGNKVMPSPEQIKVFRQSLQKLGDLYINDAFSVSHKTYSSILGDGFEKRAAGLIVNKEINFFTKVLHKPIRPFLAIFGGIKIIDKLPMIENLLDKVNEIIITGAMAFPFLKKLKWMDTGHSLFDMEGYKMVKTIMKKAKKNRVEVHFPVDFISSSRLAQIRIETVKSGIEGEWMGLDIGPESCTIFRRIIMRAKMILWNGPPGAYELENFKTGTESVLLDIVKATSRGATSVLVGEDTAICAAQWNQETNISHISSGPNAAKAILKGNLLPGLAALSDEYIQNIPEKETKSDNKGRVI